MITVFMDALGRLGYFHGLGPLPHNFKVFYQGKDEFEARRVFASTLRRYPSPMPPDSELFQAWEEILRLSDLRDSHPAPISWKADMSDTSNPWCYYNAQLGPAWIKYNNLALSLIF